MKINKLVKLLATVRALTILYIYTNAYLDISKNKLNNETKKLYTTFGNKKSEILRNLALLALFRTSTEYCMFIKGAFSLDQRSRNEYNHLLKKTSFLSLLIL